jgi:hypothetical protein
MPACASTMKATTPASEALIGCRPVLAPILAANAAFSKDVGLIVTFIGIGVLVNIIVVLIAVLVRGEYQQNREDR